MKSVISPTKSQPKTPCVGDLLTPSREVWGERHNKEVYKLIRINCNPYSSGKPAFVAVRIDSHDADWSCIWNSLAFTIEAATLNLVPFHGSIELSN